MRQQRQRRLQSAWIWVLCVLLWVGCQRPPSSATGPAVVFYPASGSASSRVSVEIMRTPEEQKRGMMFRRSLDENAGLLFPGERMEIKRFWMKNCYVPLDMIFLDNQRLVVGIEENTVPMDESSRGPDAPAQHVVEVVGGYARRHGIGIGTRAEFVGMQ